MRLACWTSKAHALTHMRMPTSQETHERTHPLARHTHTPRNMKCLLLLHGNNGFSNVPQCYVIRRLLFFVIWEQKISSFKHSSEDGIFCNRFEFHARNKHFLSLSSWKIRTKFKVFFPYIKTTAEVTEVCYLRDLIIRVTLRWWCWGHQAFLNHQYTSSRLHVVISRR